MGVITKGKERATTAGRFMAVLELFLDSPLWGAIAFGVLSACDAPVWVWVLLWIYLPVVFLLGSARAIAEAIAKAE